ncbi:MAG: amidohydrolase [Deltaproteobacteria bacterium]|jgi:predicted TIM-barrel fold metal-dependent hydrolase|nr:amidohydrolase [Deltaproteobacteria bacterium]
MAGPQTRRLFSADSHCVITPEQVKRNLASKYHPAWDEGMARFEAKQKETQAGETLELEDFVDLEAARHPGYFDSKERLKAMDADGVQCEVMYSEFDFTSKVYEIGEHWKECATAYNNSLHDFASIDPKRILITYQLPLLDIDYAASEVYRLADLGARSIQIPNFPSELGMPDYHDERYTKLFRAFEETGVVVANHLTLKNSLWDVFRRDPTPQKGIFTALPAQAIAETLCWYILTGVLERHPKLRVVFVEPGLYWVAGFIRFLDSRMGAHYEFPGVKELPSTYFKRQMAVTFVHEPEGVEMRHELGIDNVLWSTDFPHPVCNWPNAGEKVLKQFDGVPEDEIHAITWANGARMYGIE